MVIQEKDITFVDAETDFREGKDDIFNIKRICMEQFRNCLQRGSVEFRGGYFETRTKSGKEGVGVTTKTYIPDTREEYCNSIDSLYDALLPKIVGDEETNKKILEVFEKLEELRIECINKTEMDDTEILTTDEYDKGDKRIVEEYKFGKRRLYRKILQELSLFLKKINYFQAGMITDGPGGITIEAEE